MSLLWRVPLAAAAWVLARRRVGWPVWVAAALAAAALAEDAAVPSARPATTIATRLAATVTGVQVRLGTLAERADVQHLLASTGGEAEPEAPFAVLSRLSSSLPVPADSFVLIDERGQPVAWTGPQARLPVRLRPLGERTVVSEPGVNAIWVWWREPVFEAGRPVGTFLAGVGIPEAGARRTLGVWAGRAARIVPLLDGGEAVRTLGAGRVLGVEVKRTAPLLWSAPGLAAILTAGLLAAVCTSWHQILFGGLALFGCLSLPGLGRTWWMAAAVLALAAALSRLRRPTLARLASAAVAGAIGVLTAGVLGEIGARVIPGNLLWIGFSKILLVLGATLLLRGPAESREGSHWALVVGGLAVLVAGAARAEPWLIGLGLALIVLGAPPRPALALPAVAVALWLVGSEDAARQRALVSITESTLARIDHAEGPARALLSSLPGPALQRLVLLDEGERIVVLGRLAGWISLGDALPGASLVLTSPSGDVAAIWGEVAVPSEGGERELASRELANGWKISIVTPASPYDVLVALADAGIGTPVAAYDRSGAPVGRGGTFRPLSPMRVGQALAEGRSWGRVGVGERVFRSYLRSRGSIVLAVPWVRRPLAEAGLVIAALALWGAVPIAVWERRRKWREWYARRRTFAGRIQLLSVATAILPVVVLAQFLPQQWERQRERARLELGRAVSRPILAVGWEHAIGWLAREMGGTVAVYRSGVLVSTTRPDLAVLGAVPAMPPAAAYVRAVRNWREPVVEGDRSTDVYTPIGAGQDPLVVAVLGLQVAGLSGEPSPGEWFAVMAALATVVALAAGDRLGRRLAGPLGRLVGAARRLERGEPATPVEVEGDEDVASLSRAFQSMAETVMHREEQLRRGRDLLERVLGTLSAAVAVADESGRIVLANRAARERTSGDGGVADLLAEFGDGARDLLARAGKEEAAEATLQPVSAPDALWRVTVQPLLGRPGSLLVVMEDLSEVVRAQRLAMLTEAARIVAHEVKNPLTPIRLWAEELQAALERGPADTVEIARVAAEQILERVEHLRQVAQGFSNLAALERWEAEPVTLSGVVRSVIDEYAVLAQRGIAVTLDVVADGTVLVDPTWLRRALRHLLENSVRALASKAGRVLVRVQREGTEVAVTIRDSGGGVPEENLPRLFEPYFSTTSEGSGLGLTVVKRVVVRAGGHVEARNREGGLEVRLIFPCISA